MTPLPSYFHQRKHHPADQTGTLKACEPYPAGWAQGAGWERAGPAGWTRCSGCAGSAAAPRSCPAGCHRATARSRTGSATPWPSRTSTRWPLVGTEGKKKIICIAKKKKLAISNNKLKISVYLHCSVVCFNCDRGDIPKNAFVLLLRTSQSRESFCCKCSL